MKLGKTIKILRTNLGIRQKDLARRLEITPTYLSLIESGRKEPSLFLIKSLSLELNVPLGLLFWEAHSDYYTKNEVGDRQQRIHELLHELHGLLSESSPED